jgi:hypothetical protein
LTVIPVNDIVISCGKGKMEPYDSDFFIRPEWMEVELPTATKLERHDRNLVFGYEFEEGVTMNNPDVFEVFYHIPTDTIYEVKEFAGMKIIINELKEFIWMDSLDFHKMDEFWISLGVMN